MRTTLTLRDDLVQKLRRRAADEHVPLKVLVNRLLDDSLAPRPAKPYRFKWKTVRGKILPGVRLDDRKSLYDLMEGR